MDAHDRTGGLDMDELPTSRVERLPCPFACLWPNRGECLLVKCMKCGGDVIGPAKEWDMHPKDGRGPALHIKHYSCPSCGKKFRQATKLAGA